MSRKFTKIPIKNLSEVPDNGAFYRIYKNHWWIVDESEENVFFYVLSKSEMTPQCNKAKEVAEMLLKHYNLDEKVKVIQIPVMFVKINPKDYC